MSLNSFFSFSSNSCAPKKVQNYFFFKGVFQKVNFRTFGFLRFLFIQQFSIDHICKAFSKVALSRFGSGWAWLGVADGVLKVTSTANQERFGFKGEDKLVVQQWALWKAKAGWNWVELPTVNQSDISVRVSCNATSRS